MWRCEYMSRMTAPTLTTTCPPALLGGVGSLGSGRPQCPQLSTGGRQMTQPAGQRQQAAVIWQQNPEVV